MYTKYVNKIGMCVRVRVCERTRPCIMYMCAFIVLRNYVKSKNINVPFALVDTFDSCCFLVLTFLLLLLLVPVKLCARTNERTTKLQSFVSIYKENRFIWAVECAFCHF